jgi:hypothetical protein
VTETKESGRAVVLPAQSDLFATVSGLIEEAHSTLAHRANSITVFLFWRIGQRVNREILHPPARGAWAEDSVAAGYTIELVARCGTENAGSSPFLPW